MTAVPNPIDFERVPSSDGKRSNDRFRCAVGIDYASDDKSKSFTQSNKGAHLCTIKYKVALDIRARKLREKAMVKPQDEETPG
jgi:hypothetical protein